MKTITCCLVWLIAIVLLLAFNPLPATAQTIAPSRPFNFEELTFGKMPPIQSSGSIEAMPQIKFPGLNWQAGQTPDQFLSLGAISELEFQQFSIADIEEIIKQQIAEKLQLPEMPLIGKQSILDLVQAIPELEVLPIAEIPPIAQLLTENAGKLPGITPDMPLGEALSRSTALQDLKLEDLLDPEKFALKDIPGVLETPIQNFADWEGEIINQIPALNAVPLAQAPGFSALTGVVQQIDLVWSPAEGKAPASSRRHSISGSKKHGFKVPCLEYDCAYAELHNPLYRGRANRSPDDGARWYSGKYQEVNGEGFGILAAVNGGREPVGRFIEPFPLKIVLWEPDETTDTVSFTFFARFCKRILGKKTCTPYFIGPIPFTTAKVGDTMLVGTLDVKPSKRSSIPTDAESEATAPAERRPESTLPNPEIPCPTGSSGNVDLEQFSAAIVSLESEGSDTYAAIGVATCDGRGNCGRALGAYQFMSYNPYAVERITARPGGETWLKNLGKGHQPSQDELMSYFPPIDQDAAFHTSVAEYVQTAQGEIDPSTGSYFTGNRLIERAGQMHYGGIHSQIDGTATDALGRLTIKDYGKAVGAVYTSGASVCQPSPQSSPRSQPSGTTPAPSPGSSPTPTASNPNPSPTATVAPTPSPSPSGSPTPSRSPAAPSQPNPITAASPKPASTPTPTPKPTSTPLQQRATGKFIKPVNGPITSPFGWRIHPIHGTRKHHNGVDFGAEKGSPIRAADSGRITEVVSTCQEGDQECGGGFGNYIVIDHGNGFETLYAHLLTNSATVRVGAWVEQGQVIGRVGSTGWSTGPHLHFELYQNRKRVDPAAFL